MSALNASSSDASFDRYQTSQTRQPGSLDAREDSMRAVSNPTPTEARAPGAASRYRSGRFGRTGSVVFARPDEERIMTGADIQNGPVAADNFLAEEIDSQPGSDISDPPEPNQDLHDMLQHALGQCRHGESVTIKYVYPATQEPFHGNRHVLDGPITFFAAERCGQKDGDLEDDLRNFEMLLDNLDYDKDVGAFLASYDFPPGQKNVIHLIHFAASMGSVPLMEKILKKCGPEVLEIKTRTNRMNAHQRQGFANRTVSKATSFLLERCTCSGGLRSSSDGGSLRHSQGASQSSQSTPLLHRENSPPTPESLRTQACERAVKIWKEDLDCRTDQNSELLEHYDALLAAVYMSKTEAVIWLIDKGANVKASNMDGETALHMVARNGVPYEDPEKADASLERIVKALLKNKAALDAKTNQRNWNEALRKKTPLEIACNKSFAYPKHMLKLLMMSYQNPHRCKPFKEVWNVAQISPDAAELLTRELKFSGSRGWRQGILNRMLQEIHQVLDKDGLEGSDEEREQSVLTADINVDPDKIVNRLCDIMKRAPNAAANILDCLTQEPKVQDRQKNPLPNFAKLQNHIMECSYQPDVTIRKTGGVHLPCWSLPESGQTHPWQRCFKSELPANPNLHADIYPVKVRAVWFPNWLRIRMLHVLVLLGEHSDQMEIFGRLPVQAAITCLWRRVVAPAHLFSMGREIVLILSLIFLGNSQDSSDSISVFLWRLSTSVCYACVLKESWFILWEMATYKKKTREPFTTFKEVLASVQIYIQKFALNQHLGTLLLFIFAWSLREKHNEHSQSLDPRMKFLLTVNIFGRFLNLLMMIRAERGIGETILAVMLSFIPLQNMLYLIAFMFVIFAVVFITLNEHVVDPGEVIRWLYIGLFFGEGDGIEKIAGFGDDWNKQVEKTDDDHWLTYGTIAFMAMGGVIFSVILLNLIVAMYSSYYEEMVPMANLYFHKNRAHTMVRALLQPGLPRRFFHKIPSWSHSHVQMLTYGVSFCFFLLSMLLLVIRINGSPAIYSSSAALAFSGWLCQATLRHAYWKHLAKPENHYLWVCHRDDFHQTVNKPRVKVLNQVKRQVDSLQQDMLSMKKNMDKLTLQHSFMHDKLDAIMTAGSIQQPSYPQPNMPRNRTNSSSFSQTQSMGYGRAHTLRRCESIPEDNRQYAYNST